MTSLLAEPPAFLGVQEPRVRSVPPYVSTTGAEAIELAEIAGLYLDPWQQLVLTDSLGEREDGQWAARHVGLLVPRQNGKGGLLEARELAGLFILGERLIIHTAHEAPTAGEAFTRLWDLIDGTPELSKRVRAHSRAHGNEGITLKTGQRIRFRTRTSGGARGFTADCLILDEAMDIPEAKYQAVLPTLSARPNPQVWYTGSAVDKTIHENGVVFARIHERGHAGGDSSLAYFEWSADGEIGHLDGQFITDPANWAAANPALGIRITQDAVESELPPALTTRSFAVERLSVGDWPDTSEAGAKIIPLDLWMALEDQESVPVGRVAFAFDVTPDRARASIAISGYRDDGLAHLELIESRSGTGWVANRVADLMKKHRNFGVWCDPGGPAGSLIPELRALRVECEVFGAKEHAQACGALFDGVENSRLRHMGGEELENALDGATKRPLGDGGWAWDRRNSAVDISPLVAATLAHYAIQNNKKRAGGRTRAVNLTVALARAEQQRSR